MSPQFRSVAVRRGLVVTFSALTLAAVVATPNALAASSHANAHATTQSSMQSSSHADGQTTASDQSTKSTSGPSGDSTQPQPTSNADQEAGGANGQCPGGAYCSTRDGTASGNGNGGGNATGEPCAGCVGKADNKNPAGQAPNGSDANAGYECDRNHGIGRSNPAHTGCTSTSVGADCTTTPTAPGCTAGGTTGGTDCAALPDLPHCVTVGNGCAVTTMSGNTCTAVLGEKVTKTPTTTRPTATPSVATKVLGEKVTKTPTTTRPTATPPVATKVLGETVTRTPSGALPFTGANIALMTAIAWLTLLGGIAMTVAARKRRHSTI